MTALEGSEEFHTHAVDIDDKPDETAFLNPGCSTWKNKS
jgi:hypothetical protein